MPRPHFKMYYIHALQCLQDGSWSLTFDFLRISFFFSNKYFNRKFPVSKISFSYFFQILFCFLPFFPYGIKERYCINRKISNFNIYFSFYISIFHSNLSSIFFLCKEDNNLRNPSWTLLERFFILRAWGFGGMRGVALVKLHHDAWMTHNEDDFVWMTHHEDDDMHNSLTYIKICYSGVI